jgi:UDP:flavonoid glycosyltransferase YjiC (YdhE family)
MRIVLFGFGSRGDVQPLIALGKGLQTAGCDVALAAGVNFQDWIEGHGLGFEPIHIDIEAFMQMDVGKEWLGNSRSGLDELRHMKRMSDGAAPVVTDDILRIADSADVFISGLLTIEALATVAQVRGKRHIVGLLSPVAPTRSGTAGMQALFPRANTILNRWQGYFIEHMMFNVLRAQSDGLRARLGLPRATRRDFLRAWNQTPALLGVSPLVIPPPPDWGAHIHVTGYWFLNGAADWTPPPALAAFLSAGAPPVYVGFGSMSNRDPQATTQTIIAALQAAGQRGVIHSGWAGLHTDDLPPDIFLLDGAPHDWLFPRMAAVVHHGGAGTTAAALRAGVPSAVVAHIGDQGYWGRRIHELGAGAAPLRRHQLNADRLAATITTLTGRPALRQRAADLGAAIRAEDGVSRAVQAVDRLLR